MVRITTERLLLREMSESDYDALNAVLGDAENMRFYPHGFDGERVRNWIQRNIARYRIFGFGLWAVCLKECGTVIGDCGLTMQNMNGSILPEIGYHIARTHQRKGYAGEAARAVRDWTFTHTPFGEVYSYMKKENRASSATARANGMRFRTAFTDREGEISEVYAITRTEWNALTSAILAEREKPAECFRGGEES